MYIKHVLSDNTLLNSPRDLLAGNETFRQVYVQKDFFGGFLNWWPRRSFLGYVRYVCIY